LTTPRRDETLFERFSSRRNRIVSSSSPPSKYGLFVLAAAFLLASLPFQVPAEEYRSPSDGIQSMRYEDGRLSLEAKDASLDKILSELARMAMLTIMADGPLEGRITVYADRLPLEKALKKILRGRDTSFVYAAKDETSPTEYDVVEVRIYLAKADKGEARRYSYSQKSEEATKTPRPPSARAEVSRNRSSPFRPPAGAPPVPDMATSEEGQRLLSALMEGNFEGLDKIAERLKDQNPLVEEQLDQFLESLEEARVRGGEGGMPGPPMERLGDIQTLMKQMIEKGRMSPGLESE
jgi:hypothetical protein